jgi:hypothetical protein
MRILIVRDCEPHGGDLIISDELQLRKFVRRLVPNSVNTEETNAKQNQTNGFLDREAAGKRRLIWCYH